MITFMDITATHTQAAVAEAVVASSSSTSSRRRPPEVLSESEAMNEISGPLDELDACSWR
jgi:hypothetical protein